MWSKHAWGQIRRWTINLRISKPWTLHWKAQDVEWNHEGKSHRIKLYMKIIFCFNFFIAHSFCRRILAKSGKTSHQFKILSTPVPLHSSQKSLLQLIRWAFNYWTRIDGNSSSSNNLVILQLLTVLTSRKTQGYSSPPLRIIILFFTWGMSYFPFRVVWCHFFLYILKFWPNNIFTNDSRNKGPWIDYYHAQLHYIFNILTTFHDSFDVDLTTQSFLAVINVSRHVFADKSVLFILF